jgi:hypothetical protein
MKKWLFLGLLFSAGLHGALPPLAQSTREIRALLADPKLQELLGSAEAINQITRTETGYFLMTGKYVLSVDVEYGSTYGIAGPIPFSFTFHAPMLMSQPRE